jgi:hypothetical protein
VPPLRRSRQTGQADSPASRWKTRRFLPPSANANILKRKPFTKSRSVNDHISHLTAQDTRIPKIARRMEVLWVVGTKHACQRGGEECTSVRASVRQYHG